MVKNVYTLKKGLLPLNICKIVRAPEQFKDRIDPSGDEHDIYFK